MPICGFNQKMLEGLIQFHEGLVEHGLIERSKKKNQTIDETLNHEFDDMSRFLIETEKITNPEMREVIEALTRYAKAFYSLVRKNGVNNYKQTIRALNEFYVEMDNKYYSDLEGKPKDMKQLVEYLNSVEV
ncbi:MAG: hypothetical protein AABX55_00325 [Nanoarchaeota archaeon]